ncbi:uncharacterized protein N7477_000083 [Penicillium maclennaniae]|uniref:uncharacterized protein n=1 Tax=Penicillium maclennaniae TaxID=1343394 RepID=UPI002540A2B7|nr:uncharacterized protein N7477_000083 [Penicillium maclennaniae]KAJ5683738.1 hypothetical protein N7477_000083 [Penicillium maclennaniae]
MSSARLCVLILMTILSVVAAALPNSEFSLVLSHEDDGTDFHFLSDLDAFEELHVVRADGDAAHDRTSSSQAVTIPVSGLVITKPTDFLIPGLPSITATSVNTIESTAISSASPAGMTQVTFTLPGSTVTKTAALTSITKLASATPLVSVTSTLTEPCPGSTGFTSTESPVVLTSTKTEPCPKSTGVTSPSRVVLTSTETEPCPNATTTNQPIEVVVTISCSKGLCQSTLLPSVTCSGNCQPTVVPVVPCSGKCPTEPTPGVIKVGVSSTLSTGSRPTATAVIIPCSGSGCVVPRLSRHAPAAGTSGTPGTPVPPRATNSTHPVASTTSAVQYNGTADHNGSSLTQSIMIAVFLAVFLHAL